jgi:hypothetical protein
MKLNFEGDDQYEIGNPSMQFLGSKWSISGPERSIMRMVLGCCMWKSKWPDFQGDRKAMIASRLFSIFGYDHRLQYYWDKLHLLNPLAGQRVYAFSEAAPWFMRSSQVKSSHSLTGWTFASADDWKNR